MEGRVVEVIIVGNRNLILLGFFECYKELFI